MRERERTTPLILSQIVPESINAFEQTHSTLTSSNLLQVILIEVSVLLAIKTYTCTCTYKINITKAYVDCHNHDQLQASINTNHNVSLSNILLVILREHKQPGL